MSSQVNNDRVATDPVGVPRKPSRWPVVPYLLRWGWDALLQLGYVLHFLLFRNRIREQMFKRILENEPSGSRR